MEGEAGRHELRGGGEEEEVGVHLTCDGHGGDSGRDGQKAAHSLCDADERRRRGGGGWSCL
jgi:hypothetical protein